MVSQIEVLLVEDNAEDAELAFRALSREMNSDKIKWVMDGAEALDFIYGEHESPNRNISSLKVILLDLKLPRISGMEVLKKLKSSTVTKNIPVIILTSSEEEKDISERYKSGANSYIVKPIEYNRYINSIKNLWAYWMLLNKAPIKDVF